MNKLEVIEIFKTLFPSFKFCYNLPNGTSVLQTYLYSIGTKPDILLEIKTIFENNALRKCSTNYMDKNDSGFIKLIKI